MSRRSLTRTRQLDPQQPLPLLVEPAEGVKLNLKSWVESHRDWIRSELQQRGGLLLRGFDVPSVTAFQAAASFSEGLLDYDEPSTARSQVEGKVYTSTEYSADQSIPMHNELSYAAAWPRTIWFHCVQPPEEGGRTPIADSRKVYEAVDPELRRRFEERGVMYARTYGYGVGRSWTEVFGTEDREGIERHCDERGFDYEWRDEDRLVTRQVRPATTRHPITGEPLWFNQAHLHHVSALPEELQKSVKSVAEDPSLPLDVNSFYGDGSEIPVEDLDRVRDAFDRVTVSFPWRKGDVLVLDNMLVAHGREPFRGARKIVVAMSDSYGDEAAR